MRIRQIVLGSGRDRIFFLNDSFNMFFSTYTGLAESVSSVSSVGCCVSFSRNRRKVAMRTRVKPILMFSMVGCVR